MYCWGRQANLQLPCCVTCCWLLPESRSVWPRFVGLLSYNNQPSLWMALLSQWFASFSLHSIAFSLHPLQPQRSEKIPTALTSYPTGMKTRVDLRPQSRGQKQTALRKDFIQRHCVFYLAHTVVFNKSLSNFYKSGTKHISRFPEFLMKKESFSHFELDMKTGSYHSSTLLCLAYL